MMRLLKRILLPNTKFREVLVFSIIPFREFATRMGAYSLSCKTVWSIIQSRTYYLLLIMLQMLILAHSRDLRILSPFY